jgi:2-oxoglutarate ferredoxin oxidoreductase subunit beta
VVAAALKTKVPRTVGTYTEHNQETLEAAGWHRGSAFVEVLQNCNIFNDGAWRDFTDREVRDDRMLKLRNGEPMIFGKESDKGIRITGLRPEVVELGSDTSVADLAVHDETDDTLAYILSRMAWPEFPVPIGVLKRVSRPTHHELVAAQVEQARVEKGEGDLRELLFASDTWTIS